MQRPYWEELVEGVANLFFYLFAFFIVILPPLAWLDHVFAGKSGTGWVLAAVVVFVFLLPALVRPLLAWLTGALERIRKGELLRPVFVPLRAASSVLAIYGVLKLEYFVVHGMQQGEGETWLHVVWQFLTAL